MGTIFLFELAADQQAAIARRDSQPCQGHGGLVLQCASKPDLELLARYKSLIQVNNGFLEGVVRGYKAGILSQGHYASLTQCESLEGTALEIPPHWRRKCSFYLQI